MVACFSNGRLDLLRWRESTESAHLLELPWPARNEVSCFRLSVMVGKAMEFEALFWLERNCYSTEEWQKTCEASMTSSVTEKRVSGWP